MFWHQHGKPRVRYFGPRDPQEKEEDDGEEDEEEEEEEGGLVIAHALELRPLMQRLPLNPTPSAWSACARAQAAHAARAAHSASEDVEVETSPIATITRFASRWSDLADSNTDVAVSIF